jgi:hypothetical protein
MPLLVVGVVFTMAAAFFQRTSPEPGAVLGGLLGVAGMVAIFFGVTRVAGVFKFSPGLAIAFFVGLFVPIVNVVVLLGILPRIRSVLRESGYRANVVGQVTHDANA